MITIYGIKTCDTVRKALKWAQSEGLEHEFHDFRKDPVSPDMIESWDRAVGRDILVNKKGTTYRKLSDAEKEQLTRNDAFQLLADQPTIMKRPVFQLGDQVVVGFKDEQKVAVLGF